jgi:PD-(D/E)XK nuclease superfamily protein
MSEINGYTRVTDILYSFSGLREIDTDVLNNAASRGSVVHALIDADIMGVNVSMEELLADYATDEDHEAKEHCLLRGYMDSYFIWKDSKTKFVKPDRFFCKELKLTGECDLLIPDGKGSYTLIDFKTPASESKTWALQGSAYAYLAAKNLYPINKIEFVRLSRTGKAPKIHNYDYNFDLFKACYDVYHHFYKKNADGEADVLDYL